jgi:hypothetical protein
MPMTTMTMTMTTATIRTRIKNDNGPCKRAVVVSSLTDQPARLANNAVLR